MISDKRVNTNQETVIKVNTVENYNYCVTILGDKLNFTCHSENLQEREQQRLVCLRKPLKFQIDKSLMILFYRSHIDSVLTFSHLWWFGNLNIRSKKKH